MILRLFLDAGWPAQHSDCDWQWLDDNGHLLRRGAGDIRTWPGRESKGAPPICEIILSSDQVVCLNTQLPAGAAGKKREVVRFAIEERLIGNIDEQHCVAGERRADGATPVLTLPRTRLANLLAALGRLNLVPLRVLVEAQMDSVPPDGWILRRTNNAATLVTAEGWLRLDDLNANVLPPLLLWAYDEAIVKPHSLVVVSAVNDLPAPLKAWAKDCGLRLEVRREANRIPAEAVNLLQGEFAPAREVRAWRRHYRPLAWAAAVGALGYAVFSLTEWAWLAHSAARLKEQEVTVFHATFPQVRTIVSAPLQMQRNLDSARQKNGMAGSGDYLALLANFAAAAPPDNALEAMSYDNNRLKLKLKLPNAQALDTLTNALRRRGLHVDSKEASAAAGMNVTLTLSKD